MQRSTLQIAWRNLGRNRKRTLLAVGAIALGQLTLVFVNCLMAGSFHNMIQTVTGPLIGHVQIHHREWREERAVDLFIDSLSVVKAELATIPEVSSVSPRIYAPALVAPGEESDTPADAEPAIIVGVDVAAESGKGGLLEFTPPAEMPSGRSVLIGKVLARRLGIRSGQLLAVIGQDADGFPVSDLFEVAGIIQSNVDVANTLGVVMALADAGAFVAMPDQSHEIIVQGNDYEKADALAEAVGRLPNMKGMEVITWKEAVPQLVQMIKMMDWVDLIFVAIVFVAAAAGIANTALMSTFERTREFGMLLAMGSRPDRIVGMVVIESLILGLIGVAIGSVLGTAIVLITSHTGIDYAALGGSEAEEIAYAGINISYVIYPRFEARHIVAGLCAVTLTSVLASLWPAVHAARLEPVEAMRK